MLEIKITKNPLFVGVYDIKFYDKSVDKINSVIKLTSQDPKMADFIGPSFKLN